MRQARPRSPRRVWFAIFASLLLATLLAVLTVGALGSAVAGVDTPMSSDASESLDPATGERIIHSLPGHEVHDNSDRPVEGSHAIEKGRSGTCG